MKEELETKILKSGQMIIMTAGEWSDYGIIFAAKALKDFNVEKVKAEFPCKGGFNEYSFGIWLVKQGYVEEVEMIEWALGNYGKKNELSKQLGVSE